MNGSPNRGTLVVVALVALVLGVVGGVVGSRLVGGGPGPQAAGDASEGAGASGGGDASGGASGGAAAQGPPPAAVRVAPASEQVLQDRFDIVGRLQEIRRATIAAEVEGKVLEVSVEAGDRVIGGETILARIDPVWARAMLSAAEARVASAEAELDQSRRDLAYLEQLQTAGSAKPKEVDDARAAVKSDEAEFSAARAELEEAATRVERLTVVAPFDGAVVEKLVEVGQWVEPGAAIAEMISTQEIDAVVNVPERLVNRVSLGDRIEVSIEPLGETVEGRVVAVVPAGSNAARTFPVKVRLPDQDGRLMSGMSVIARLPVGESRTVLTVPRDAVMFQNGRATVWVAMSAEGSPMPQAAPVSVEVLFGAGDSYAVNPLPSPGGASLSPQTPVVIEGAEALFATQPLQILEQELANAR